MASESRQHDCSAPRAPNDFGTDVTNDKDSNNDSNNDDWIYRLTESDLKLIEAAVRFAQYLRDRPECEDESREAIDAVLAVLMDLPIAPSREFYGEIELAARPARPSAAVPFLRSWQIGIYGARLEIFSTRQDDERRPGDYPSSWVLSPGADASRKAWHMEAWIDDVDGLDELFDSDESLEIEASTWSQSDAASSA